MGLIRGIYGGRSDAFQVISHDHARTCQYRAHVLAFQPGGMSYECGFVPHGVAYEEWKAATEMELTPQWISDGTIGTFTRLSVCADPYSHTAFMFESSRPFTLTDFAFNRSGVKVCVYLSLCLFI